MTWHLKDRELEKKLIELYPDFLKDLKFSVADKGFFPAVTVVCTRSRGNEEMPQDEISFWLDELEEIPEYNPKDWNDFPKITPPHNVTMQIEYDRDFPYGAVRVRVIGIYDEHRKCWFMFDPNSREGLTQLGCPISRIRIYDNLRFRPLED